MGDLLPKDVESLSRFNSVSLCKVYLSKSISQQSIYLILIRDG